MVKKSLITVAARATGSVAHGIELTDFMDPNTAYDDAYVDSSATANSGNQDQLSYSTFLDGFYNKRRGTQRQVWSLGTDANALASRGPSQCDDLVSGYGLMARSMSDDELLALAAIIGREEVYGAKYGFDDYKGIWYTDIEGALPTMSPIHWILD